MEMVTPTTIGIADRGIVNALFEMNSPTTSIPLTDINTPSSMNYQGLRPINNTSTFSGLTNK